ncbi:hypothetical protein NS365_04685 [Aureimonas ureilytica]|uniref:Uncharacterized protein n=1 Tax=Aureimonas ureilytica TaxID=401562 RepID=A0A175RV92_9HYPH|nr:hypothetical protein [Aureimonas ureilytica]KTR07353.1 hypothetical protein NS365_04685 [Aureimonas ureilytica]
MRAALALEAAEIGRIISHYLPLGRALRLAAELAAVASMIAAVTLFSIASTTPAPRAEIVIAEANR